MDATRASSPPALPAPAEGRVSVLLPLPLPEPYDYRVPPGLALEPGSYVLVPLGPRAVLGVVWGPGAGAVAEGRLKPVGHRFDLPPMPAVQRRFIDWVAAYTMSPPGAVLRMALSVPGALESPRGLLTYRLGDIGRLDGGGLDGARLDGARLDGGRLGGLRMTPARRRILDL